MNKYKIVSVIIITVIFVVVGIIAGKIHREDNLIASGEALVVSEPAVDQEALQVISFYPATPMKFMPKFVSRY